MAWSNQSNKEYQTKAYKRARLAAIRRDSALCQYELCVYGRIVPFDEVDHIENLASGKPNHHVDNLQCLSKAAHWKKTQNESHGRKGFPPIVDPLTGWDIDPQQLILECRGMTIDDILARFQKKEANNH